MNLFDMHARKDRAARFSPDVTPHKLRVGPDLWRGLSMPNGSWIVVPGALQLFPIRDRPAMCGWTAKSFSGREAELDVAFMAGATVISSVRVKLDANLADVPLPWSTTAAVDETADLVLAAHGSQGEVFLGVSRGLDRHALISRARGQGVEIGPGLHPQIRASPDNGVDAVLYLEQQSAEDWRALYAAKQQIDRTLWDDYRQGTAEQLPVADESLDFIFSSHVFEHLSNPIGHLRHWSRKLRPGGVVLAIVPELGGAKDYRQIASPLSELLEEDQLQMWEPGRHHYERYVRNTVNTADAEEWMRNKRSIHAHFYTPTSASDLLTHACEALGFSTFEVVSTPNNKEFHFIIQKGR